MAAAIDLDAIRAERLADLRLAHRRARIDEGWAVLGIGIASMVAGGIAAGAGYQSDEWLGLGLGTAAWGALNALFSLALVDLDGSTLRDIEADRALRGRDLDWAREDWARDQYGTAALIAVNAGLDVFYILGGIALFVIGDQASPDIPALEGYAIAMTSQGTILLVNDVVTWIAAQMRGDEARVLFRDEEGADEATP